MAKIRFAYACSLASLATVLLGSVSLPQFAVAQNAAATNSTTTTNRTGDRTRDNTIDPGVRGGPAGAGGVLPGLRDTEKAFFEVAKDVFQEVDAVPDGLGPRFNLDSCSGCHLQPSVGGSSPAVNPQIEVATKNGAKNTIPSFITANGPVREARFVRKPDGSPDGGVQDLFVITGRADAPGCNIRQPDFAGAVARNNVIFRIPTPTFGLGLVESVTDAGLQAALAANVTQKQALGISGRFNRNGNDGTITRFGWKAQNKSLLLFSGEAYNVEIGVTNDLFPNDREGNAACQFTSHPESPTPLESEGTPSPSASFQSDIVLFAAFMRLLAAPTPAGATAPVAQAAPTTVASADTTVASVLPSAAGSTATTGTSSTLTTATVARGAQVFANVGCQACHTKSLTSGKASIAALSEKTFQPFSDFALHDMGDRLADGVSQGEATGREFRTAPLWGVGQRIFFLHDGRTNDLYDAIQAHASRGSEANEVIQNYNLLSRDDKQAVVNFLRSL
jgi:CxxC motif-containing protein (DUF1111 family)